jgi:hypothetical protein
MMRNQNFIATALVELYTLIYTLIKLAELLMNHCDSLNIIISYFTWSKSHSFSNGNSCLTLMKFELHHLRL